MATAKYGAIITEMKGKIGGTIFQGSRVGGIVKNKAAGKASSGTSKLTKADAGRLFHPTRTISQIASSWRSLSASDQLAWATAAPSFPFLNKYGVPYTPSGYQLFMSVNTNLVVVGEAAISLPPTPSTLENCPAFDLSAADATHFKMNWLGTTAVEYNLQILATTSMSRGKQPQKGDFKLIKIVPLIDYLSDIEFYDDYVKVFGTPLYNGAISVTGKLTKADAGRVSQPFTNTYVWPFS